MSATLSNSEELARWLGAALHVSDFRPVPLDERVLVRPRFPLPPLVNQRAWPMCLRVSEVVFRSPLSGVRDTSILLMSPRKHSSVRNACSRRGLVLCDTRPEIWTQVMIG